MRAIRIHAYGGPEVMRIDDLPQPVAGEGERLVKLTAASVNPIDWKMRQGLMSVPLPRVLGRDGACAPSTRPACASVVRRWIPPV